MYVSTISPYHNHCNFYSTWNRYCDRKRMVMGPTWISSRSRPSWSKYKRSIEDSTNRRNVLFEMVEHEGYVWIKEASWAPLRRHSMLLLAPSCASMVCIHGVRTRAVKILCMYVSINTRMHKWAHIHRVAIARILRFRTDKAWNTYIRTFLYEEISDVCFSLICSSIIEEGNHSCKVFRSLHSKFKLCFTLVYFANSLQISVSNFVSGNERVKFPFWERARKIR